ncbi:MAG TPA: sigma-70 family RNA polymerase sigma factor [Polyangiaceae bacterium]|nr:sigma-70 family RNA polymerase sigma factor [Polyangiaceae bacterium]
MSKPADAAQVLVRSHFEGIWRLLRRLGLPRADADDAAQQVFILACTRMAAIQPGSERAFLYGCALKIAAKWRALQKKPVQPTATGELDGIDDDVPSLDELVDQNRARALLDVVLKSMPSELRTVFVLFELEEFGSHEIAALLGIPRGTAASRLRRAREDFAKRLSRIESRFRFRGTVA